MSTVPFQQTALHLSRQTRRWDRRLRLVMSAIWLPRGLIVGLLIGIALAGISRLRPWLLPDQIALASATAVTMCGVGVLIAVWGWPRSTARNARFFDRLFDLKERVSTALELAGGVIPVPEILVERQLNDAVVAARKVDASEQLPFQARFWEVVTVLILGALLIYMLIADNPMSDTIREQRDLENAINQQIQNLDQAIEDIEANEALTPEEQEALTQPLQGAQDILQQPDVSQQEAMAAMAEASDQLNDAADGMSPEDESAYQNAANNLNQSQMTSDLAQAFQKPDLSEAGDAMDKLAEEMNEEDLSQQQRDDLAEQLEQAADEIEETNPALAQKMRETADALREGDMETAQEAARETGELMREQEEALENSPSAQAAQEAQEQVNEGQEELAQSGQEGEQQQSTEQGQQQGESQAGEQQENQQAGQAGEQSQSSEGQTQQEGEGQQSQGQNQSSESSETGQQAGVGDSQQPQQSQNTGGDSAEAGEGEGGAGSDNIQGVTDQNSPGETTSDNSTGGGIEEFQPEFESFTVGGQSDDIVDVSSDDPNTTEGETINEGELGPNPEGESTLSYTGVYNEYRDIVSSALESGRIPLDQRDIIHDYFSSLDQ